MTEEREKFENMKQLAGVGRVERLVGYSPIASSADTQRRRRSLRGDEGNSDGPLP